MSFPNYKKSWFKEDKPDGWEDLGEIGQTWNEGKSNQIIHSYCKTPISIGREDGSLFQFCPRCLVRTEEDMSIREKIKK